MLRVGLTGGIASGKSTVASMLRSLDYQVLDADLLSRELLEPGQEAYREVVREFGNEILEPDGTVNRGKLGEIVFSNGAKRERLNQILHPRIRAITAKWFAALDRPGGPDVAFKEAALTFEAGARNDVDRIVVCWCRPEQQLERMKERGMRREDAERRIAAQMPIDEKRRLADDVIDCSGSIEKTERQVKLLADLLKQQARDARKG